MDAMQINTSFFFNSAREREVETKPNNHILYQHLCCLQPIFFYARKTTSR